MRDENRQGAPGAPPRRLVDGPSGSEGSDAEAWAVDLLRSEAPYQAPAGRKQRVQLSLGHVPRRRAPLVVRAAAAAIALLGCGAIASAALGRARWPEWMARAYERLVPSRPSAAGPRAHARRPEIAERAAEGAGAAPASAPAQAPVVAPEVAPVVAPEVVAAVAPRPAPRRVLASAAERETAVERPRRSVAPAVAPAPTEDTAPVLEAMRALRLERNPVRARALLARYLERHPSGTLAEEALAMTIEAAVAHHDADAAALSARYLRLYPLGPFRSIARQTLAAGAPQPAP
jgi:hypothetical protein